MQNGIATFGLAVSYKTKHILPSGSLLFIYPEELKSFVHTKPDQDGYSSSIHKAKTYKQPRCLLGDEWMNKLCHIQTMDVFHLKRKELSSREKDVEEP